MKLFGKEKDAPPPVTSIGPVEQPSEPTTVGKTGDLWFKTLSADGRSADGGDYLYVPGVWAPCRPAVICESGYHLTQEPERWMDVTRKLWPAKPSEGKARSG